MFATKPDRKPGAGERARRRELERCLDPFGFVHGLRLHRGRSGSRGVSVDVCALRDALESLGPVFKAFGIYLSSRADLFSPRDCMELSRITDAAPPLPFAGVRGIIEAECGVPIEEFFQHFEQHPRISRLAWQSHLAVLRDGSRTSVRILNPRFIAAAAGDDDFLVSCDPAYPLGAAAQDFRAVLARSLDLRLTAAALKDEGRDAGRFQDAVAPQVARDCATQMVLGLYALPGELSGPAPEHRHELARQLCLLWLRQALEGQVFAADPRLENTAFFSGRRLSFTAGDFSALAGASQHSLWEYLDAASNDDPDAAAEWLLREMTPAADCLGEKIFIRQVRQIVPFRDGGWAESGGQTLPERLFLQWQTAVQCGYRPQPHLIAFWRGLFSVTSSARELAQDTQSDAFLGALSEYRSIRLVNQIQSLMDASRFRDRLDSYTVAAVDFPKRMNQLLDLAEGGRAQVRVRTSGARRPDRTPGVIVLMALLASTALWTSILSAHSADRVAIERAGAAIFFLVGVLSIRFIVKVG